MNSYLQKLFVLTVTCLAANGAMAQEELQINGVARALIPVSITGFSGETQSVLAFDLSVMGIRITSENPQYVVSGSAGGQLSGSLSLSGKSPILSRVYSGGSARAQAHSFADDIIKELRGTAPIFHTKIAYRCQQAGSSEVFVADFDGHNPIQLTHDNSLVDSPSWAPGGQAIFYTSWKSGNTTQILEHDLSSGARKVFAGHPGSNLSPAVSPDGRRVAMILSQGGSPNLWVANRDGSGLKQLTKSREEDSCPTWSPDSSEICFVHRSGRATLRKINASGGESVPVSAAGVLGANLTGPNWSPDGKLIAFTVGSMNFTICVAPASGGEAQKLVAGEDPCWAPNSRTIIFSRRTSDKRTLCLLDAPTKQVKDVRQISGSCSEPSWAR
ncbi:MAG TPA: hypothetical protein VHB20_12635 [Verrucomicrobiae bacterium]|nr:hypothetical protein [Verrucomicrobiae bacterium]